MGDYSKFEKRLVASRDQHPLMAWDVIAMQWAAEAHENQKEQDKRLLKTLSKRHHWQFDIEEVLGVLYDALVLTDVDQKILWVNEGFRNMTGYPVSYAIGKKPSFLQGKETSPEKKRDIEMNLLQAKRFEEVILNYRKDGTKYACEIEIFPIRDRRSQLVAFLALEREVHLSKALTQNVH